ncbi:MAG: hypothetical protein ACK5NY_02870 [Burkholderiaceae bacterium]|jgi:hypothetical protein
MKPFLPDRPSGLRQARGFALPLVVVALMTTAITVFLVSFSQQRQLAQRRGNTQQALADAKTALLGNAFDRLPLTSLGWGPADNDFGSLPCPDTDNNPANDTETDADCGSPDGSSGAALRLGRLPLAVSGLQTTANPGEPALWYAVSNNFKRRRSITGLGEANPYANMLNSETPASLRLLNPDGSVNRQDVAAVLLAPGRPLTRSDGIVQSAVDEGAPCAGRNSGAACQGSNFLDLQAGIDNAAMGSESLATTKDFISAPYEVTAASYSNDQLLTITVAEWRHAAETRLARMLARCYVSNAVTLPAPPGGQPYAVPTANSAQHANWTEVSGQRIGRIPNFDRSGTNPYWRSALDPKVCNTNALNSTNYQTHFWPNWRGNTFLATAQALYLNNNNWLSIVDEQSKVKVDQVAMVVIFSGPVLKGAQQRTTATQRGAMSNFLESAAESGATPVATGTATPEQIRWVAPAQRAAIPFNDRICYITANMWQDSAQRQACQSSGAILPEQCGRAVQCLD